MRWAKFSLVATTALVAAGCAATDYDVEAVAALNAGAASPFTRALHREYVDRARFEVDEIDWRSVSYFNGKAAAAAAGEHVLPQEIAERKLPSAAVPELEGARGRLVAALESGAGEKEPVACAKAQAWFDHWLEQQAEAHQADHIAMTRDNHRLAMLDCAASVPFIIYFDFDDDGLNAKAQAVLEDLRKEADERGAGTVRVAGHADTAGARIYNKRLSENRAKAVAAALKKMGLSQQVEIQALGETAPAFPTGDNVREERNRRVEIYLLR